MTIQNPPISEGGAAVHARNHRKAFSGFIPGQGIAKATDLTVTGDPVSLAVNITPGCAYLLMPDGTYDIVWSTAVEQRRLTASPPAGSGARIDLIYAGIQSLEFPGDTQNLADIRYKANPSIGTGSAPTPDTMSGAYPIASVLVPAGAQKGTDCTITMLSAVTAPVKDGGWLASDIAGLPFVNPAVTITLTANGFCNALAHGAPFTPSAIIPVQSGPVNVSGVVLFRGVYGITSTTFDSQWIGANNAFPAAGTKLTARLVCIP